MLNRAQVGDPERVVEEDPGVIDTTENATEKTANSRSTRCSSCR